MSIEQECFEMWLSDSKTELLCHEVLTYDCMIGVVFTLKNPKMEFQPVRRFFSGLVRDSVLDPWRSVILARHQQ